MGRGSSRGRWEPARRPRPASFASQKCDCTRPEVSSSCPGRPIELLTPNATGGILLACLSTNPFDFSASSEQHYSPRRMKATGRSAACTRTAHTMMPMSTRALRRVHDHSHRMSNLAALLHTRVHMSGSCWHARVTRASHVSTRELVVHSVYRACQASSLVAPP